MDTGVVNAQLGACEDLRNPLPQFTLSKKILNKRLDSQTVQFDATTSGDDESGLVHIDFYVVDRIRDEIIYQIRRPAGSQASFTHEFPRGKYMIYATAFDRYGANTQPKKRALVIR